MKRLDFPIPINWTSSFPILGLLGSIFHFFANFNRTFSKQTVKTLISHRVLGCLIWVHTVCPCPAKTMQGLDGLIES